jgi:hypothetical protein
MFTLGFVQAVNDWQRGGNHQQKVNRGARLKQHASTLPEKFRLCDQMCFRQEAHEKERVWQLLADNCLPETIASWTTDLKTAKTFKGGVPPPAAGLQSVIFSLRPAFESVVLNLVELYTHEEFLAAVEELKSHIVEFANGIGRWRGSQNEVVLELFNLNSAAVHSYGGYSGTRESIAELYFQRQPTAEDLNVFDELCVNAGVKTGEWWLSECGTRAVLKRMEPHIQRLKEKKAQEKAGD